MSEEHDSFNHSRDIKISRVLSELLDTLVCDTSETANLFTKIWYHGDRSVITLRDEEGFNEVTIYPLNGLLIGDDPKYANNNKQIVAIGWRYVPLTDEEDLDFVICVARGDSYYDIPFTGVEPNCQPLNNVHAIIITQSMNTYYLPLVKNLLVNRFTKYNGAMFKALEDDDWVKANDSAMVAAGVLDLSPCVFNGNLSATNEYIRMKKDHHTYNNSEALSSLYRSARTVNDGLGKKAGYDFLLKKHGVVSTQMLVPNNDLGPAWSDYVKGIIITCLKDNCKRALIKPWNDRADAFATLKCTDTRITDLSTLYVADNCVFPMFALNYLSMLYPRGYNMAVKMWHHGRALELLGPVDLNTLRFKLDRYYDRTLKNRERSRKAASERRKARRNNAVTDCDFDL